MDMQMYNLVKDAMRNGKSIEDVISEVNTMAETAKKEIQPQAPLLEKYGKLHLGSSFDTISLNSDGSISKIELITLLARYYVQNGFNPDPCFDTEKEFLDQIAQMLDNNMGAMKAAERLFTLKKEGASEKEVSEKAISEFMDMLINSIFDSKD